MKNDNERYILTVLFLATGLIAFTLLARWLRVGHQEARPISTDWPEWKQKEWEKEPKKKGSPRYPKPTNAEASPKAR